jgi:hypothetical protein
MPHYFVEQHMKQVLQGCRAALAVNSCAPAVLLCNQKLCNRNQSIVKFQLNRSSLCCAALPVSC